MVASLHSFLLAWAVRPWSGPLRQYLFFPILQKNKVPRPFCGLASLPVSLTSSLPKSPISNGLHPAINIYSLVNKYPLDTLLRHTDSSIVAPYRDTLHPDFMVWEWEPRPFNVFVPPNEW